MKYKLKEPYISPSGNYYSDGIYLEGELPPALFKNKKHLVEELSDSSDEIEDVPYVETTEYKAENKLPVIKTPLKEKKKPELDVLTLQPKAYPSETVIKSNV
jgi:hypothetical protein